MASYAADIATNISGLNPLDTVSHVLLNLGANEMPGLPAEATWKADYQTIIDAIVAKWSDAVVYIAYPWRQGQNTNAATLHGWIDGIIASNPGVCFAGPDEAVTIKSSDDGATNTYDGIHYSAAGNSAWAAAWLGMLD